MSLANGRAESLQTGFDDLNNQSVAPSAPGSSLSRSRSSAATTWQKGFKQAGGVSRSRRPWSGSWWPRNNCSMSFQNYSDGLAPLEKYDTIHYNVRGSYSKAAAWEADPAHSHNRAAPGRNLSWAGHCNGWAAASVLEPEPRSWLRVSFNHGRHSTIFLKTNAASSAPWGLYSAGGSDYWEDKTGARSMTITVADQKAWLTEIYQKTINLQFSTPGLAGTRYSASNANVNDSSFLDIEPHYFHYLLAKYVKNGRPIIIDQSTGDAVWNYPLFWYESSSSYNAAYRVHYVSTKVWTTDVSSASYVGTKYKSKTYTYKLQMDSAGRVSSGSWVGSSVRDHPDFVWIPVRADPSTSGTRRNPQLDHGFIKSIIKPSQFASSSD